MKVIALYNIKGGVGKTASAVNLAYLSAQSGFKTLLWDLDLQGSATYHFSVNGSTKHSVNAVLSGEARLKKIIQASGYKNLDLVKANFDLRKIESVLAELRKPTRQLDKSLGAVSGKYDYVFLDCPAGFSTLSRNVVKAADVLLAPIIPSPLSIASYEQLTDFLKKKPRKNLLLLPFFSMVDRRKKLHREFLEKYENGHLGFLSASIPYSSAVEKMAEKKAPLPTFSRGATALKGYQALWEEVQLNIRLHDRIRKIKMW